MWPKNEMSQLYSNKSRFGVLNVAGLRVYVKSVISHSECVSHGGGSQYAMFYADKT